MHFALLSLVLAAGTPSTIDDWYFPKLWFQPRNEGIQPAPFKLASEEEARLVKVLDAWEKANRKIKTFDCKFKRWEYSPDLATLKAAENQARHVDFGIIKYAAPDKGFFQTLTTEQTQLDGTEKEVPIEEDRAQRYLYDGKSFFWYETVKKIVHEHLLPSELRGRPPESLIYPHVYILTFKAKKLRARLYLRIVTPKDAKDQIWIEAYPRFGSDAAHIHYLLIILDQHTMRPLALKTVFSGGKQWFSYKIYDVTVNDPSQNSPDAFKVDIPRKWKKEIHAGGFFAPPQQQPLRK